jgi:hypothetical protein
MVAGTAVLTLKRTWIMRIVLCIFLLPLAGLLGWGAVASGLEGGRIPAAVLGVLSVAAGVFFAWQFRRETTRQVRLYEDRIEQFDGVRTRAIAWDEVREVWFRAIKVQAGGLLGVAVSAAVDAARKSNPAPLSERSSSITVRLVGAGTKLKLNSNDKGVVAAFEEILRRVNPRLVDDSLRAVHAGQAASFGKLSLSIQGLAIGRKGPIPFTDVQTLAIQKGKLVLKKQGAWLATAAIPIHKIPNVFCLMECYRRVTLAPESAKPTVGRELAQQHFM